MGGLLNGPDILQNTSPRITQKSTWTPWKIPYDPTSSHELSFPLYILTLQMTKWLTRIPRSDDSGSTHPRSFSSCKEKNLDNPYFPCLCMIASQFFVKRFIPAELRLTLSVKNLLSGWNGKSLCKLTWVHFQNTPWSLTQNHSNGRFWSTMVFYQVTIVADGMVNGVLWCIFCLSGLALAEGQNEYKVMTKWVTWKNLQLESSQEMRIMRYFTTNHCSYLTIIRCEVIIWAYNHIVVVDEVCT